MKNARGKLSEACVVAVLACVVAVLVATISGCSSWDNMSRRQKSAVGGAAIGGVIGDQIGR